MKKIIFIADFFTEHVLGGGELNNEELILELRNGGYKVDKTQSHLVTKRLINSNKNAFFIVSNYINLSNECRQMLMNLRYLIYEHDHKYLKSRNPATYRDFKASPKNLINFYFYKNAMAVLCQSKFHKEIIEKNLKLDNVINLGGNLWSEDSLHKMKEISKMQKQTDKISIMESDIEHKNTLGAIRYCSSKDLKYELISDPNYFKFLEKLGSNSKFLFLPKTPETLSRILVEARMMGCSVVTNNLAGAISEEWFSLKGEELIEFMYKKRSEIISIIERLYKRDLEEKRNPLVSIITTFHEGKGFLNNFLENITNQTIFNDCELIIIDAGSCRGESELIKKYLKKFDNIVYKRLEEKEAITPCLNRALELSNGEYVTFAFIDDVKRNDCLEVLYNNMKDDTTIDLVYGDVYCTEVANEKFEENSSNSMLFDHSRFPFSKENMIKCLPGPMPLWRRNMHDKYGFFDSERCNYADDWEMWLRSVSNGSRFKKIDEVVGLYYSGGRSSSDDNLEQKREEARIFYEYRNLFGDNYSLFKPYFDQFVGG